MIRIYDFVFMEKIGYSYGFFSFQDSTLKNHFVLTPQLKYDFFYDKCKNILKGYNYEIY